MQSLNHYDGDDDSPSWTQETADRYTRPLSGLSGMAGILDSDSGQVDWQLTSLHGDLVAAIHAGDDGLSRTSAATEYGTPRNADDIGKQRYGWLGAKQRAADAPAGIVLMGVRLYNTVTGRFLQTDPVYGGNANPYDYCTGDPVNCFDLDGRWSWKKAGKWWNKYGERVSAGLAIAGFAACAIATAGACVAVGAVAAGVSVAGRVASWKGGYSTGKQAFWGAAGDVGAMAIPGARLTRTVTGMKAFRQTRYVRGWGRTTIKWRGAVTKQRSYSMRESYNISPRRHVGWTGAQFAYTQFGIWRGTHGYWDGCAPFAHGDCRLRQSRRRRLPSFRRRPVIAQGDWMRRQDSDDEDEIPMEFRDFSGRHGLAGFFTPWAMLFVFGAYPILVSVMLVGERSDRGIALSWGVIGAVMWCAALFTYKRKRRADAVRMAAYRRWKADRARSGARGENQVP